MNTIITCWQNGQKQCPVVYRNLYKFSMPKMMSPSPVENDERLVNFCCNWPNSYFYVDIIRLHCILSGT